MSVTVPNWTRDADPLPSIEPRWVRRPFIRKSTRTSVSRLGAKRTPLEERPNRHSSDNQRFSKDTGIIGDIVSSRSRRAASSPYTVPGL